MRNGCPDLSRCLGALVKLVVEEPESDALERWLAERVGIARLTSELAEVELIRACRRRHEQLVLPARLLLASMDLIPPTPAIREHAALVSTPAVRSLDAIHLASALSVGAELSAFVAYDRRLQAAAADEHLPMVAPGL